MLTSIKTNAKPSEGEGSTYSLLAALVDHVAMCQILDKGIEAVLSE